MDDYGEDLHPVQDTDAVQPDVQEGVGVLEGTGGRVKVLASEVVKGAHPREGGGERSQGRSAVSAGACCAIKSLSLWFVIWGIQDL